MSKAKTKGSGKARYANMPDTPILPKPKGKPMVVWVVIDGDGLPWGVFVTKRNAVEFARVNVPTPPYRVVRFVAPPRPAGGGKE